MVDPAIVMSVRRYLRTVAEEGIPVRLGVIFGSCATGTADRWSDIDLVVVSSRFDAPVDRKDVNRLWHIAARTDSRIEPVACGELEWWGADADPIIEIARSQGLDVEPEGDESS